MVPSLSGRLATTTAVAGVVLMGGSGFLIFAAGGFRPDVLTDPSGLVARGSAAAELIRWASFLDLFGYLMLAPLAIYFHERFKAVRFIALYSFAGLIYILIGATGAVILGTAGPPLMRAYQSALESQRQAITSDFVVLHLIVARGLWQTLEGIPAAVWLIGVGHSFFRSNARTRGLVMLALGTLFALGTLGRLLSP